MIVLDLPARMTCVEKDCAATQPVKLFLNTMGCLQFRPEDDTWQVLAKAGEVAPYMCRCPVHRQRITHEAKLQVGPSGPRVKVAEH